MIARVARISIPPSPKPLQKPMGFALRIAQEQGTFKTTPRENTQVLDNTGLTMPCEGPGSTTNFALESREILLDRGRDRPECPLESLGNPAQFPLTSSHASSRSPAQPGSNPPRPGCR